MPPQLDPRLLQREPMFRASEGELGATLEAHGQYHTFRFVVRLSPLVHNKIAGLPSGIVSPRDVGFDGAQAFSTYLHETIHWWQHVGSTYGLMLSLSYPSQAHANYKHLKELVQRDGFKKPIRKLALSLPGPGGKGTLPGLANTIVNNHFDFSAFRSLTYSSTETKAITQDPYFESVGHSYWMTYANNVVGIASVADPEFQILEHPREWEDPFRALRDRKEQGFYYGSPVELWPVGAHEILEGQACFGQLQYLAFASGGTLGWDDFRGLGMLHGVYVTAFETFLRFTGVEWPPKIDHPTVGLFLIICDMAINPASGFPHRLGPHFKSFITDVDPGARFTMLCAIVRLKCPGVTHAVKNYSRLEYDKITAELAAALLIDPPLAIAATCAEWAKKEGALTSLMEEYETFAYKETNLPVRVLFTHFLAFMRDKFSIPEFFCWPGAWMAGERVSEQASILFDRHAALFVDKADDDGIFPRIIKDRNEKLVYKTFNDFYAVNITYDMTDQWITRPGPFIYNYRWLSQSGSSEHIKAFVDGTFGQVYGVNPDNVELV